MSSFTERLPLFFVEKVLQELLGDSEIDLWM